MGPQTADTQIVIEFSQWNVQETESDSLSFRSAGAMKGVCWKRGRKLATRECECMHIFTTNFGELSRLGSPLWNISEIALYQC